MGKRFSEGIIRVCMALLTEEARACVYVRCSPGNHMIRREIEYGRGATCNKPRVALNHILCLSSPLLVLLLLLFYSRLVGEVRLPLRVQVTSPKHPETLGSLKVQERQAKGGSMSVNP